MRWQLEGPEARVARKGNAARQVGWFNLAAWGYLVALATLWFVTWLLGDKWWFATVLLYGPRWIYCLPLVLLVPSAVFISRSALLTLGISFIIALLFIMDFNIPFKRLFPGVNKGETIKVMTYNIHRWDVTNEEFAELLLKEDPDLVAIQECASPRMFKGLPGWNKVYAGESLVFSKFPVRNVEKLSTRDHGVSGLLCLLESPMGPIYFCCIDLLTPRKALSRVLTESTIFDLTQTDYARKKIIERQIESKMLVMLLKFSQEPMILAGDFNLTVDSNIYRKYWSGYINAFSSVGWGFGYTKRTKINIFRYGTRIDHILSTRHFRPVRCWVGPDYGSDHFPLLAELQMDLAPAE